MLFFINLHLYCFCLLGFELFGWLCMLCFLHVLFTFIRDVLFLFISLQHGKINSRQTDQYNVLFSKFLHRYEHRSCTAKTHRDSQRLIHLDPIFMTSSGKPRLTEGQKDQSLTRRLFCHTAAENALLAFCII